MGPLGRGGRRRRHHRVGRDPDHQAAAFPDSVHLDRGDGGRGLYGPNLTPDKATGLGNWTDAQIVAAIRTGKRPDGRELAPIMPYHAFAALTDPDVQAIVAFLRTIKPVSNKVPGPFGPSEKPTSFVMQVIPAEHFKPTPLPEKK
jgi:hypothetical protein